MIALLFEVLILARLGKARAGSGTCPLVGEVRGDVPGGCATHREAPHEDAVAVDAVVLFDGIESFEKIDFSRELGGVAIAAVEVQHDRVGRSEFTGTAHAFAQKIDLAPRVAAPREPGIETPGRSVRSVPASGDHEAIRLDAAIDL